MSAELPNNIENRLQEIRDRLARATPGEWHVNYLDDSLYMNLVAVTLRPDSGAHETLPYDDPNGEIRDSIVATTLIQAGIDSTKPFVEVDLQDGNWDEDAEFIAHAKSDIEFLLQIVSGMSQRSEQEEEC